MKHFTTGNKKAIIVKSNRQPKLIQTYYDHDHNSSLLKKYRQLIVLIIDVYFGKIIHVNQ
ncbi:hypothetical protein SAMN05421690_10983 [Nitrosomonas sp. Nm51]|nr:hypothetical protein SAMN05421690_10983 [Nitrosomonas sp. Nm51]